jgi:diacylglycerol kinase (ATP)
MTKTTKQATLIHNPNAAGTEALSSQEMVALLREAGYEARHRPTEDKEGLGAALSDPGDVVVAAGGDGTVREVALYLSEHEPKTPLAILPLGTANNIARTLGLSGPPEPLIAGLARPRPRPFDLGLVTGPFGQRRFLEAFGFGLFAFGLFTYHPEAGKSLPRLLQAAGKTLSEYQARDWRFSLDGEDLSGRYLMVEVMNTTAVGLRLRLSPDADPGDGRFDVVLIREDDRVGLSAYVASLMAGTLDELPNITVKRGNHLELLWDGSPLHWDEEVWPEAAEVEASGMAAAPAAGEPFDRVDVSLEANALELWLPTLPEEGSS